MREEDRFHRYRPHPWHGLAVGPEPPSVVTAFIEITPFDLVKYEVDKDTGFLRVDRPQRTSSLPPALYGFVPGTYCGERVAALMPGARCGDGDPLDICVVSERPINRAGIVLDARVIGGLPMLDDGEADDKILAVLVGDPTFGSVDEIADLPSAFVDRLHHYFLTYKALPGEDVPVEIGPAYGAVRAREVVEAAVADYQADFGEV